MPRRPSPSRRALAALASALSLSAGCASVDPAHDWWSVRHEGVGEHAAIRSTSHVNVGKPPRGSAVVPRALRDARRGAARVELLHDAALADDWAGAAWKLRRETEQAATWLARMAGPDGARLRVTLVDDDHAFSAEHVHEADVPTVELYVAVPDAPRSLSAVAARALATGLHEAAHALSGDRWRDDRGREEYAASLVQTCYLIQTLRPGDDVSLALAAPAASGDGFAMAESREAAARVIADLRAIAGADTLRAGVDTAPIDRLAERCARAPSGSLQ